MPRGIGKGKYLRDQSINKTVIRKNNKKNIKAYHKENNESRLKGPLK
jgi:hypothetical protein